MVPQLLPCQIDLLWGAGRRRWGAEGGAGWGGKGRWWEAVILKQHCLSWQGWLGAGVRAARRLRLHREALAVDAPCSGTIVLRCNELLGALPCPRCAAAAMSMLLLAGRFEAAEPPGGPAGGGCSGGRGAHHEVCHRGELLLLLRRGGSSRGEESAEVALPCHVGKQRLELQTLGCCMTML